MDVKIRSTTILGVRKKGQIAIGGDGQVTFGDMAFKQKAIKVREFDSEKGIILGGFAGAAADALTLFEKFESKLDEYEGNLTRAVSWNWLRNGVQINTFATWKHYWHLWIKNTLLSYPVMGMSLNRMGRLLP